MKISEFRKRSYMVSTQTAATTRRAPSWKRGRATSTTMPSSPQKACYADSKKRKSTDAGALTWDIGQKRPPGWCEGSSERVDKMGSRRKVRDEKDARAAARRRSNGVKFLTRSNAGNHSYYKCASHEDRGCLCVRACPDTHRRAVRGWPVERRAVRRARRTRRFGAGSRRRRSTTRGLPQFDTSHHQNAQRRHLAQAAVLTASARNGAAANRKARSPPRVNCRTRNNSRLARFRRSTSYTRH